MLSNAIEKSNAKNEENLSMEFRFRQVFLTGSSGGSASDYNADDKGFAPRTGGPCLGPPCLNGYRSLAGNLTAAEKGTGRPTPSCR